MTYYPQSATAPAPYAGLRVVAVHAHPDDEVLFGGGVLAELAAAGAQVTLVTVTLGENGEVIGGEFDTLCAFDQLGGYRLAELLASCAALGIANLSLGGPGFFRDSGMAGSPEHEHPRALVNRIEEAAEELVPILTELRPHVLFTYGPDGGYGHPDHIAVHQAVNRALERAEQDGTPRPRVWWPVFDRATTYAALETLTPPAGWSKPDAAYLDNFTNDAAEAELAVAVQLSDAALAAKRAAMAAHPTQIWLADGTRTRVNPASAQAGIGQPEVAPAAFALSNLLLMPLTRTEHFHLGTTSAPVSDAAPGGIGQLLAGLDLRAGEKL